ncbi:MAG: AAA family ATPase [Pseudomonadota bacterium]
MKGRVIILNGVSSAGKTTLARAIQAQADRTFLHVEMDRFISFLPDGDEFKPEWFELIKVKTSNGTLPRIANGPRGSKLLKVMRQFVVDAAREGLDLVVDEVCHASDIANYRSGLAGCTTCFVKVDAPMKELERREEARGDRLIGLAREQSGHLHVGIAYDLEVDTSASDPAALANRILTHTGGVAG